jgi:hypothetical protein
MSNIQLLPSVPNPGYYNQCSGALSIIVPQESINFITEPSFEIYNNTNWPAPTNWKIELHTGSIVNPITSYINTGTKSYDGASSLYSYSVSGNHVKSITYASIPVSTGFYAWSFYIRGDVQSNGRLYTATIRNSSTNALLASKSFTLIENQWNRIELVWYSTSAVSVSVGIEKEAVGGSYAGGNCWIDACQFEKLQTTNVTGSTDGLHATTYFDGNSLGLLANTSPIPEYSWKGRPHRSVSVRSKQTLHGGRIINLQDQCSLEIISINEAGINQPTNHDNVFNTADGAQLVDIVNSKRTITMIGRVSGTDKNDFAQKITNLSAYFSRDVSSLRTPRRFIFQHKDNRDNLGVEITFFAAFESGLNVTLSDVYVANIEISLTMYDPYFYGHDESIDLSLQAYKFNITSPNRSFFMYYSPNISEMVDPSTFNPTTQILGVNRNISFSNINVIEIDNNGIIWIGGSFTSEISSGTTYNRIVKYNPVTKTLSAVLTGATNGVNGTVHDIKVDTQNRVWVAGAFTSAGGVADSQYIAYYDQSLNTFVAPFPATKPNNTVNSIAISKKTGTVAIGGEFTLIGAITANRVALSNLAFTSWAQPGGNGVNGSVFKVYWPTNNGETYNTQTFYVGGNFSQISTGGTADKIATMFGGFLSNIGYGLTGSSGQVIDIIDDDDDNIIFRFAVDPAFTIQIQNYTTSQVTANYTQPTGQGYNSLCYYNQSQLNFWPVSSAKYIFAATIPTTRFNTLQKFRGGIVAPEWGNYWPGTVTSATNFARYNDKIMFATCAVKVAPDQTLYIGTPATSSGTNVENPLIQIGYNSSTVSATPVIQNLSTQTWPQTIINWQNNRLIDLLSVSGISLNQFRTTNDYVLLDFRTLQFTSYNLDSFLQYIQPNSNITNFEVMPGTVYLSLFDGNQQTSATPTVSTNNFWNMFWKQTFQSIFDGISKS